MSASPTPTVIPRQYDIEVGPWDVNGNPTRRVALSDLYTNCSYFKCTLVPDALHVGLMFSTGDFLLGKLETPPNSKSLWMIALTPTHMTETFDHVNTLHHLDQTYPVYSTGSIFYIKWNHKYIIQSENGTGILLRIVQHNPEPIDDTMPISYHNGNPTKTLTNHIDMKSLLSRLQVLSNISHKLIQ
jgi:hypothetical protein